MYDTKQKRRIQHIPRSGTISDASTTYSGTSLRTTMTKPNMTSHKDVMTCDDVIRSEVGPPHIAWKDDVTLLIGWAYDIKVGFVLLLLNKLYKLVIRFALELIRHQSRFIVKFSITLLNKQSLKVQMI